MHCIMIRETLTHCSVLLPICERKKRDRLAADRAGVVALVGERITAGMAEHVGVRLEIEARGHGHALDHPGKAGGRERRAARAGPKNSDPGKSGAVERGQGNCRQLQT
jgi:hypothetical protein